MFYTKYFLSGSSFAVFVGLLTCALNTALLVTSKLSLLYLLSLNRQKSLWYASLAVVFAFPECVSVIELVWSTSFIVRGEIFSFPALPSVISGLVAALLEAAAVVFFVLRVAHQLPGFVVIPLLASVYAVRLISQIFKRKKRIFQTLEQQRTEVQPKRKLFTTRFGYAIAGIGILLCVVSIACVLGVLRDIRVPDAIILPVALLTLTFVWCPSVQAFTIRSRDGTVDNRQKGALLYSVFRIGCMTLCVFAVIVLQRRRGMVDAVLFLVEGFGEMYETNSVKNGLLIHCISGLLVHAFTYTSAQLCMTYCGMAVPAALATPVTVGLVFYGCEKSVLVSGASVLCSYNTHVWIVFGLAVLVWAVPFLALRSDFARPPNTVLKPLEQNFIRHAYSSIFMEHQIQLNYKPHGFRTKNSDPAAESRNKISKIFICTTMYREADFEMERLLRSLQTLSSSKKMSHVYMESHVILDKGTQGTDLSEFTLQLLSLLQTKFDIDKTDVIAHMMPYGLQLQYMLRGGMPLFLHLKDDAKVKTKKRWSQVLYMKYILEHRVGKCINWLEMQRKLSGGVNANIVMRRDRQPPHRESTCTLGSRTINTDSDSLSQKSGLLQRRGSYDSEIYTGDEMSSAWSDSDVEKNSLPYDCLESTPRFLLVPSRGYANEHVNNSFVPNNADDDLSVSIQNASSTKDAGDCNQTIEPFVNEIKIPIPDFLIVNHKPPKPTVYTVSENVANAQSLQVEFDERTYILATDADMEFNEDSVLDVLNTCNQDLRLGGACGRTHPVGEKNTPIVWFQMFEYAKDFWMIKSAQNVIGSVMCCPGCFSLYRLSAIKGLIQKYSKPSVQSSDVFIKDTGEDRWMTTLMMLQGWKMKYCTFGQNTTYCPSNIEEFLKQRRRWMLSDLANTFLVMKNMRALMRNNQCFTVAYVLYLLQLFLIVLVSPGSTLIMLTAGIDMVFDVSFLALTIVLSVVTLLYMLVCIFLHSKIQTYATVALVWLLGLSMSCVFVGGAVFIIRDILTDLEQGTLEFQEHYILILLTASVFYAALLHPHETWIIFLGIFYMFMFPAMHILLPVYAISNIVDQSWGTRDGTKAKVPKMVCFPKIRRRRRRKKKLALKKKRNIKVDEKQEGCTLPLQDRNEDELEYRFWRQLREKVIGKNANMGADKSVLDGKLKSLRIKAVTTLVVVNGVWIALLSVIFSHVIKEMSKLNTYALISGVLYGISFLVQLIGMTVHRIQDTFQRLALAINGGIRPEWITTKRLVS